MRLRISKTIQDTKDKIMADAKNISLIPRPLLEVLISLDITEAPEEWDLHSDEDEFSVTLVWKRAKGKNESHSRDNTKTFTSSKYEFLRGRPFKPKKVLTKKESISSEENSQREPQAFIIPQRSCSKRQVKSSKISNDFCSENHFNARIGDENDIVENMLEGENPFPEAEASEARVESPDAIPSTSALQSPPVSRRSRHVFVFRENKEHGRNVLKTATSNFFGNQGNSNQGNGNETKRILKNGQDNLQTLVGKPPCQSSLSSNSDHSDDSLSNRCHGYKAVCSCGDQFRYKEKAIRHILFNCPVSLCFRIDLDVRIHRAIDQWESETKRMMGRKWWHAYKSSGAPDTMTSFPESGMNELEGMVKDFIEKAASNELLDKGENKFVLMRGMENLPFELQ